MRNGCARHQTMEGWDLRMQKTWLSLEFKSFSWSHLRIDASSIGQWRLFGAQDGKGGRDSLSLDILASGLHLDKFVTSYASQRNPRYNPIRYVTLNQNQARDATRHTRIARTHTKQAADKQGRLLHVCVTNSCIRCCTMVPSPQHTVCILKP